METGLPIRANCEKRCLALMRYAPANDFRADSDALYRTSDRM